MSDENRAAFRRTCNEYLRKYHSSKVPAPRIDEPTVERDGVRTFAGRYMGDWEGEHGDVQIVAADLLAAIDDGRMLVITPNNPPAGVVAELRRMFDDPAWWEAFRREVESA